MIHLLVKMQDMDKLHFVWEAFKDNIVLFSDAKDQSQKLNKWIKNIGNLKNSE